MVLKALSSGTRHGYGVARWIEDTTDDVLSIEEGSLYPALHRMERRGWIESQWGQSENNRRAKFYRLTRAGRARLEIEAAAWARFARAVSVLMGTVRLVEG
jgi:transcriptional regulator